MEVRKVDFVMESKSTIVYDGKVESWRVKACTTVHVEKVDFVTQGLRR